MLEEKDLQAIAQMMEAQEKRLDQKLSERLDQRLSEMEQRITKNTVALMDMEFSKKFNLLAEGIEDIQEKLVPRSRVDDLEDEVKFLKSMMRQMNEDLQKLKKAN